MAGFGVGDNDNLLSTEHCFKKYLYFGSFLASPLLEPSSLASLDY